MQEVKFTLKQIHKLSNNLTLTLNKELIEDFICLVLDDLGFVHDDIRDMDSITIYYKKMLSPKEYEAFEDIFYTLNQLQRNYIYYLTTIISFKSSPLLFNILHNSNHEFANEFKQNGMYQLLQLSYKLKADIFVEKE